MTYDDPMETESERLLRIAMQSGIVVGLIALKPVWMKWLYKLGYRDWREKPTDSDQEPKNRQQ